MQEGLVREEDRFALDQYTHLKKKKKGDKINIFF